MKASKFCLPAVPPAGVDGLRSWRENAGVIRLARDTNHPIVSGGDRHCSEPKAIVNLTNAATFAEFAPRFAAMVSQVAFMPQHREPIRMRVLQTMWDSVSEYSDSRMAENTATIVSSPVLQIAPIQPLSVVRQGNAPAVVKQFLWLLRLWRTAACVRRCAHALNEGEEFVFEP